jgi:hypothetical protein
LKIENSTLQDILSPGGDQRERRMLQFQEAQHEATALGNRTGSFRVRSQSAEEEEEIKVLRSELLRVAPNGWFIFTELADLLKATYQVRLLLGSAEGEDRASRENIERVFDQLLKCGLTKDYVLLVALSGHGLQMPVNRNGQKIDTPFFCPRGAVPGRTETMVNLSDWLDRLRNERAGSNFMLVDACRNNPDPTRGTKGIDGDLALDLPPGMGIFFSCSRGERSRESPKAGGGHGLFFHFVLEALKGDAVRSQDGNLFVFTLRSPFSFLEKIAPKRYGNLF